MKNLTTDLLLSRINQLEDEVRYLRKYHDLPTMMEQLEQVHHVVTLQDVSRAIVRNDSETLFMHLELYPKPGDMHSGKQWAMRTSKQYVSKDVMIDIASMNMEKMHEVVIKEIMVM